MTLRNLRGMISRLQSRNSEEVLFPVDMPLLIAILMLLAVGLVVLYSASAQQETVITRQVIRIGISLLIMLVCCQLSPIALKRWSPLLYSIGLLLLLLVLVFGITGKGAQRWIDLGFFQFQPSEMMKLAVPMMLAWVITQPTLPTRFPHLAVCIGVVLIPVVLVVLQPDLGTAILIASTGVAVIFMAGISWKLIVAVSVALGAAAPLFWIFVFHDYQKRRILTLFDPWNDHLGAGYHTIQSMIAIGSGGIGGKGWLGGTQTHLEFIPERSTDFVFSVYAEEFGWIGAMVLLLLYVFIVLRGLIIAFEAPDAYSRLVAGALSMSFFFYVFVNIGMVAGVLPVVGLPLPLISYGGTSMLTMMIGFGILMSIRNSKP